MAAGFYSDCSSLAGCKAAHFYICDHLRKPWEMAKLREKAASGFPESLERTWASVQARSSLFPSTALSHVRCCSSGVFGSAESLGVQVRLGRTVAPHSCERWTLLCLDFFSSFWAPLASVQGDSGYWGEVPAPEVCGHRDSQGCHDFLKIIFLFFFPYIESSPDFFFLFSI